MRATFIGSQSVRLKVPQAAAPIQHYLRQPHRLVTALAETSQIESLGQGSYRLKMKPRQFLMFNLQPTVDLQIEAKPDGTILLTSDACELKGIEFVNDRFKFNLKGVLTPVEQEGQTLLKGQADLQVQVELPPVLWMTPKAILQAAGNGFIKSILATVKQKLAYQLLADYQAWARTEVEGVAARSSLRNA